MKNWFRVSIECKYYKPGSVRPQFNSHNYYHHVNTVLRHIRDCEIAGKEIRIEEMLSSGDFVLISCEDFRRKYVIQERNC